MNLLIFYFFSTILVASAIGVVASRNTVHSVLFLILSFFCVAGIFILQGAEFLAMLLVIVYVGAVAILFLFVVMMLNINYVVGKKQLLKIAPFGVLFAVVFILEIYVAMANRMDNKFIAPKSNVTMSDQVTNTHAIGQVLYTDFFMHFQLAGMVLFLAMIGAVMLTHQKRTGVKKQSISSQVNRSRKDSIKIVKVLTGKGV